jgi:hypothetical protein
VNRSLGCQRTEAFNDADVGVDETFVEYLPCGMDPKLFKLKIDVFVYTNAEVEGYLDGYDSPCYFGILCQFSGIFS